MGALGAELRVMAGKPNAFAWHRAGPAHFVARCKDFDKKYQPKKIVLEQNYRSSQAIIDASRAVISHNPREEKVLVASGENKNYAYEMPDIVSYETEEAELIGIAESINSLIASGVQPSEIGVIYGRTKTGDALASILRGGGILYQMKDKRNLFDHPFFEKVLALLQYLALPSRNSALFSKILYFDFFDVDDKDIVSYRESKGETKTPAISDIAEKLEGLRLRLASTKKALSPIYVLQELMRELAIDRYVLESPDKIHLIAIWTQLNDLMKSDLELHPDSELKDFLAHLTHLKEMDVKIEVTSFPIKLDNCVQLMTAHGSKGLEFDHVFMVKCNDTGKGGSDQWPGGESKEDRTTLPPSLDGKAENEKQLKEEENRRLFYVAMTRAKKELHLSFSEQYKPTKFLEEIPIDFYQEITDPMFIKKHSDDSVTIIGKKEPMALSPVDEEVVKLALSNFSLSVSSLNSFLKCPLSFYYNKVLKFPAKTNEAMTFGSIIHETLEAIYLPLNGDKGELSHKNILPEEEAIEVFKKIFNEKSHELPSDRAKRDDFVRGLSIIRNLYTAGYFKDGVYALEKNISGIRLGDIRDTSVDLSGLEECTLTGNIDKIEMDGNIVRIIDYKTGSSKNAKSKLEGPSEKNPIGGDYWRQAVFYQILLSHSDIDLTNKKLVVQYVFVENEQAEFGFSAFPDFHFEKEDLDFVLSQIAETYKALKAGAFTHGGDHSQDKYDCDYCSYALLNQEPLDNAKVVEEAILEEAVKTYKHLSVSTLNKFLQCQRSFYFDQVLGLSPLAGLKGPKKEHQVEVSLKHAPTGPLFGTLMHETMEAIYRDDLNLEEAVAFYLDLLKQEGERVDQDETDRLKKYGPRILTNLFKDYIPSSVKEVELEKELRVELEGGYPIMGIVDKIEFDGDIIRVVDYKTGIAEHGKEELAKGGNYWRQAVHYNLLLEHSSQIETEGKIIETQFIFLDDEKAENGYSIESVTVSPEDLEEVKTQIKIFWDLIRKNDYTHGCEKADCDYCRLSSSIDFNAIKKGE